jgi:ADP-ribosylglycohydrolase
METSVQLALLSLEGLSVGDAFGEQFFALPASSINERRLPPSPWPWTDDTHMALSITEVLVQYNQIDQDALARAFAKRFRAQPYRGYARGAMTLLRQIDAGGNWRALAPTLFGIGSYGNGAAMRAAPIGGFFAGDPARAATEAQLSAVVTHAHPEGQAGAMAVAAAAAIAAIPERPVGQQFLQQTLAFVPPSITRQRIEFSMSLSPKDHLDAMLKLGTGNEVSAQDTVPFCLWCAAYHLDDFVEALWQTVSGYGDCDTTCAIVGGIVALSVPPPSSWIERREPLPSELRYFKPP